MLTTYDEVLPLRQAHLIVIGRVGEATTYTIGKPCASVVSLEDSAQTMRMKRTDLIRAIEVEGRVLLHHNIHRTAHAVSPELVGDDPLVDLDMIDHIYGDVIETNHIGELPDRLLIYIDSHTLTFEATYREARATPHPTCLADRDASCTGKDVVDTRGSTL